MADDHGPGGGGGIAGGAASAGLAVVLALLRTMPEGPLRSVHSGRIGDYVAWTAVGAAAVASRFALTLA
jgi:hypothetical protein